MPGVQTLDFKPFPVELTPFAGLLSDGAAHTLSVSVFGANSYFSVAGNLFVYLDHGATTVTGALLRDTLKATPKVTTPSKIGSTTSTVNTSSSRDFTISGYVDTSAGRVTTTVHETTQFYNDQTFKITDSLYNQQIKQDTETLVDIKKVTGKTSSEIVTQYSYPLTLSYVDTVVANGNNHITTGVNQGIHTNSIVYANGLPVGEYDLANAIAPVDTLILTPSYNIISNKNQSSAESYATQGTGLGCYSRVLTAVANVLTADTVSTSCK